MSWVKSWSHPTAAVTSQIGHSRQAATSRKAPIESVHADGGRRRG